MGVQSPSTLATVSMGGNTKGALVKRRRERVLQIMNFFKSTRTHQFARLDLVVL